MARKIKKLLQAHKEYTFIPFKVVGKNTQIDDYAMVGLKGNDTPASCHPSFQQYLAMKNKGWNKSILKKLKYKLNGYSY